MFEPCNIEKSDPVLYELYMAELNRNLNERRKDMELPNPPGKTYNRLEIKNNPLAKKRWLSNPTEYDVIGVDSQEPSRFIAQRKTFLYHGTKAKNIISIFSTMKLYHKNNWRVKGSGLTKELSIARSFGGIILEVDAYELSKINQLIEIIYDKNWFIQHPEYARKVCNKLIFYNTNNPTEMLSACAVYRYYEEEITSRYPIKLNEKIINRIFVSTEVEKEFKCEFKKLIDVISDTTYNSLKRKITIRDL